jgi:hypothetical protein
MGLDLHITRTDRDPTMHARWSYNGFNLFRQRLAKAIGVDLDAMVGFGGDRPWSEITDDLVPLLNHSDCDGTLDYTECYQVAPRLREIVADWPEDDYDRQMALRLAAMMNEVARGDAHEVIFE